MVQGRSSRRGIYVGQVLSNRRTGVLIRVLSTRTRTYGASKRTQRSVVIEYSDGSREEVSSEFLRVMFKDAGAH